jgi:hypothetical protein
MLQALLLIEVFKDVRKSRLDPVDDDASRAPRQAPLVGFNLECLGLLVCLFHFDVFGNRSARQPEPKSDS